LWVNRCCRAGIELSTSPLPRAVLYH